MTRLAILADIHGNLPALEAVLDDLVQFKVDRVIVAGDVINWGPFSAQVLERVIGEGWVVVRGNNELYLLDYGTLRAPAEWTDLTRFPLLPWLQRQLPGAWKQAVAGWPESLSLEFSDGPALRVFHGSPRSPKESIYPKDPEAKLCSLLENVTEAIIIAGHTHLTMDRQVGRWHVWNPGSVGGPVDGVLAASYLLLETEAGAWRARFRRIPYDDAPVFREFERQGFVDECGIVGRLIIREFETARLQLWPFMNWHDACRPEAPFTSELLDEFARVDPWQYTPAPYHVNRGSVHRIDG